MVRVLFYLSVLFLGALGVAFHEQVLRLAGAWLVVDQRLPSADLVVALGGDARREDEAALLWTQGQAKHVLFAQAYERRQDYHCRGIRTTAAIVPPHPAWTLYDEAMLTLQVMEAQGMRSVIVVTSPHQLRRTRLVFTKVFEGRPFLLGLDTAPEAGFSIDRWWASDMGRARVAMEYGLWLYYRLTL